MILTFISALSLTAGIAQQAETEAAPPPAEERIEASLPDVYFYGVSIDAGLEDWPDVLAAIRAEEVAALTEFAARAVADHQAWVGDAPGWSWNEWSSNTDISITLANSQVVSLDRRTSFYTGGAHPNQAITPIVTLTGQYDPAGLRDLIADTSAESPAMTALFYAVYRELMALKRERLGVDFDEAMERETWLAPLAAEPDAFPGFTLIPNEAGDAAAGLMFHFEPYAVGSYAEGSYDVPVPLSVFRDYLTPDWAEIFSGQPVRAVLTEPGDSLEPIIPEGE
jgi:hypothetical protein